MDMRRRDLPARPSVPTGTPAGNVAGAVARPAMTQPQRPAANTVPARPTVGSAPSRPVAPMNVEARPVARPTAAPAAGAGHYAAAARPQTKGEDLAQVIRQLTDLLTKENAALKRHRFEEVKDVTERK